LTGSTSLFHLRARRKETLKPKMVMVLLKKFKVTAQILPSPPLLLPRVKRYVIVTKSSKTQRVIWKIPDQKSKGHNLLCEKVSSNIHNVDSTRSIYKETIKTEFIRRPGRGNTCHLSFMDETLPD